MKLIPRVYLIGYKHKKTDKVPNVNVQVATTAYNAMKKVEADLPKEAKFEFWSGGTNLFTFIFYICKSRQINVRNKS